MRRRLRAGAAGEGVLLYGTGHLDDLGLEAARALGPAPPGDAVLVTDRTVDRLYGKQVRASLARAGFHVTATFAAPPGERGKTLEGAGRVLRALARARAHRRTPLVALGGGVVTDLAGFAAAVYARGMPWVAVPTTLLGMADAAVGGKTGVDLPEGKNLAGAFHHPRLVLADAEVLGTLPARHVRNGLAEVAKVELLDGFRGGLPRVRRLASAAAGEVPALAAAAARAARAKADLVAADPLEREGLRVLLNLGHTAGHAIEAASGFRVLHGEAVAAGMVVAARVAVGRGLLPPGDPERLAAALRSLGLPDSPPAGMSTAAILRFAGVDKKRTGRALRMVLPRADARAVVAAVEPAELRRALAPLR